MGYNPWLAAAKAAWNEVSSLEAREFFQVTAIQHTLMVIFGIADLCVYTIEAGEKAREFVHNWAQTPTVATPESEVAIAGLLPPATMSITTQGIVTNKLEQHIENTLREIYNVSSNQECNELGDRQDCEAHLELIQEPVRNRRKAHQDQQKTVVAPRIPKKTRSSSSDSGQADNTQAKKRVPRSKRAVLA